MKNDSNIRTLRTVAPAVGPPCSMCGSHVDVVLCSFAFERVHRRVPLCRGHRQPLIEMDHFTRPQTDESADVPAAWLAAGPAAAARARLPRRRRPAPPVSGGATLTLLADRRSTSQALATSSSAPGG